MPDVEITRKQIIVVGEVKGLTKEQYPKWVFTDKGGNEYKINPARKDYFTDVIKPGIAVELSYSKFKNNEYIYSATPVKDKLPDEVRVDKEMAKLSAAQQAKGDPPGKEIMAKSDWAEKDRVTRKSIERQTTLKAATDIACALIGQGKEMSPTKVIDTAKLFEAYLEGKEVIKNKVVEAALNLGGKIIEEGEEP